MRLLYWPRSRPVTWRAVGARSPTDLPALAVGVLSSQAGSRPTPRRAARERGVSHVLLLLVLAGLLLLGGAAVREATLTAPPAAPTVAPSTPAPPAASLAAPSVPHLSGGPAADPISTWVETIRVTTLWSSPDPDASALGQLTPDTYVQVTGPVQATRVPVRYASDGSVLGLIDAWVDVADVSGAAAPTAQPLLAVTSQPTAAPTQAPAPAPRKTTDAEPPPISATYAVVVDGASGAVLYDHNAHGRVAPASLTKIVTAQLALDHVKSLDDQVTVDVDSRVMYDSTIMGLTPGMTVSVRALLYGLMLPSGNDAALALARYVGGSDSAFVAMMNQRVADLGLHDSHFVNPHGLDADGHYSSPYDIVMLARHGMENGTFQTLAAAKSWQGEGFAFTNLNKMLWLYPGVDGVKVGYTDNSGRSIVASATVDGHRVFVGMMRAPDMLNDCIALFNYVFNNYEWSQ